MSSVNDLVRKLILTQPGMFKNRLDVLEYVFTNVNNGFMWDYKGDVVEDERIDFNNRPDWSPELEIEKIKSNNFPEFIEKVVIEKAESRISEYKRIVSMIDLQMDELSESVSDGHIMLNPECLFCQMPENVSSEWRNAADELIGKASITVTH